MKFKSRKVQKSLIKILNREPIEVIEIKDDDDDESVQEAQSSLQLSYSPIQDLFS